MQFKTLVVSLAAAGVSSAAPAASSDVKFFGGVAIRSGSAIQNNGIQAAHSSIFIGLPTQGALCDKPANNEFATFSLNNGELYLYASSNPPQQVYVDRSGMGQGVMGFTTGAQPAPVNGERKGFEVDAAGNLTFNGAGFIACPNSIDGAWSVWVSAGVANPGGNSDCVSFSFNTVGTKDPNSCHYTF